MECASEWATSACPHHPTGGIGGGSWSRRNCNRCLALRCSVVDAELDKLGAMFERQRALQVAFKERTGLDFIGLNDEAAVRTNVLAGVVELTEILRETNWKTWRGADPAKPDWGKYCEEVADLFKFALNLAMIGGMDADALFREFCAKDAVNAERVRAEFSALDLGHHSG